jgi:hypothetical protein
MPIQINEIVIRAIVQDSKEKRGVRSKEKDNEETIISKCVERVIEILKEKKER